MTNPTLKEELEAVKRDIEAFKSSGAQQPDRGAGRPGQERPVPTSSEELSGAGDRSLEPTRGPSVQPPIRQSPSPVPESFFACSSNAISETGYGEELVCCCDAPKAKPSTRCPIHGSAID